MPILMLLPPRRFNGIMALQIGMLGFGTNELLEYRTGKGVMWWATKPYRLVRGVSDVDAENETVEKRLKRRREMKEEMARRRIAEDQEVVVADAGSRVAISLEEHVVERRGREG
jgi:hypothetical protein